MVAIKTKETNASVHKFIDSVDDVQKQADTKMLLDIFKEITKQEPKMWGSSIIGYGNIHYVYESGREGDWMATGFSPRKTALSLYVLSGVNDDVLKELGTYKRGKSCLYIKRLSDIDLDVLKKIIQTSYQHTLKTQKMC